GRGRRCSVAGPGHRRRIARFVDRTIGRGATRTAPDPGRESRRDPRRILRHAEHAVMSQHLADGFADPVPDAQRCFRAVLDAMAHPGRITRATGVTPPAPLSSAAGAVLLTLVDHETPLWLDPDARVARRWIEFHCGAPIVSDPASCGFAVALSL